MNKNLNQEMYTLIINVFSSSLTQICIELIIYDVSLQQNNEISLKISYLLHFLWIFESLIILIQPLMRQNLTPTDKYPKKNLPKSSPQKKQTKARKLREL